MTLTITEDIITTHKDNNGNGLISILAGLYHSISDKANGTIIGEPFAFGKNGSTLTFIPEPEIKYIGRALSPQHTNNWQEFDKELFEISPAITTECLEFCKNYKLQNLLSKCLCEVTDIFSNITRLNAEYDYFRDEESEDSGHIVIRVEVSSDQQIALRDYDKWVDWIVENLTAKQRKFFTLTIRRV